MRSSWLVYLAPYSKLFQSRGWAALLLVALFCIIKHFGYLPSLLYSLWASWLLCLVPSHLSPPPFPHMAQLSLCTLNSPRCPSLWLCSSTYLQYLLHYTSGAGADIFPFLFIYFFSGRKARWGGGTRFGWLIDAGNKREKGREQQHHLLQALQSYSQFW